MTGCAASDVDAGGNSAAWVGYTWRIVDVQHGTSSMRIPDALNGFVAFAPDRTLRADDGVNAYFGSYAVDVDGYRPNNAGSTAVGYAGHDPVRLALIAAVQALTGSDTVATHSDAPGKLQLVVAGYTVTCAKHGIARNELPQP